MNKLSYKLSRGYYKYEWTKTINYHVDIMNMNKLNYKLSCGYYEYE